LALGFNWVEACTASTKCNAWKKFNILIKVKNHKKFTYDYYSLLKLNGPKGPINPALPIKAELCSLGGAARRAEGESYFYGTLKEVGIFHPSDSRSRLCAPASANLVGDTQFRILFV
jgi:hypothetical protein